MRYILITIAIVIFAGCSVTPQFYPNSKLKDVGKIGAHKDYKACEKEANLYLDRTFGKDFARGAGKGAAIGAAVGLVKGALTGNLLEGVIEGTSVGAAAGGTAGALKPDVIKRQYINTCLGKKGYEIIGWD